MNDLVNEMNQAFEEAGNLEVDKNISITDLDQALIAVRDAECAYEDAHAISSARYKEKEEAEQKLIKLMSSAGKDRWECAGVKGFSLRDVFKFRVPNSPENKKIFFDFLKSDTLSGLLSQDNESIFLAYTTCNHNSLNSLMNKVTEESAERGIVLPETGLDQPIAEKRLVSLRSKK